MYTLQFHKQHQAWGEVGASHAPVDVCSSLNSEAAVLVGGM
jgi:hypothetical protein